MRHTPEYVDRIRFLSAELENLARGVCDRPAAHTVPFVRRILAHLMRADGGLSAQELRMLAGFNQDGFSWHEEVEFARETVEDSPRFLVSIPAFVRAAIEHDARTGNDVASRMVETTRLICELVVNCDGVTDKREVQAMTQLLETLSNAVHASDSK